MKKNYKYLMKGISWIIITFIILNMCMPISLGAEILKNSGADGNNFSNATDNSEAKNNLLKNKEISKNTSKEESTSNSSNKNSESQNANELDNTQSESNKNTNGLNNTNKSDSTQNSLANSSGNSLNNSLENSLNKNANELDNAKTNSTENTLSLEENTNQEANALATSANGEFVNNLKGVYNLAVGAYSSRSLEVGGSATWDNAQVDIWDYGNVDGQKFNLEFIDNSYYKITARHSGKALTVSNSTNSNIKEGAEIVQSTYTGANSQKWIIRDSKINGLVISPLNDLNLAITVEGNIGQINNGAKLILSKYENNANQMLYFFKLKDQIVKEGLYNLAVGKSSNKSFEIAGSLVNDGAKADIWDNGNVPAQRFWINYDEAGYYKILASHTGKALSVKGATYSNGVSTGIKENAEIVQSTYTGADSQKWIIKDSNKNGLVISSYANPTLSITVSGKIGQIDNGAKLILSKTANNDNQMLYFFIKTDNLKTISDGTYQILAGANQDKSMEVAGSATNDNATVDVWDFGNVDGQKFNIEYQSQGFYKITAKHSGKALTVKAATNSNGASLDMNSSINENAEIVQSTYTGADSQKWLIRENQKNNFVISPMFNPSLAITISGEEGQINNGAKLVLKNTENNANQIFYIIKSANNSVTLKDGLYKVLVGKNPKKSIEVGGSATWDNANIDIWDYFGNAKAQKFEFKYEYGYYTIKALHSQKVLIAQDNNINQGTNIVQAEPKGLMSEKWIIRDSNKNGLVISPMLRPDLAITINNTIQNGEKLVLKNMEPNDNQMFYFYTTDEGISIDSSKYPGVAEAINKLVDAHPNWTFEPLYTGLDFNTVINAEYNGSNRKLNLVYTKTYNGAWIAPNPYVSGPWASASWQGIAYFMDVRNFLNDEGVFQFVDLNNYESSGATLSGIQYQVNGTFLQDFANDIQQACKNTNINPYYVIARLIQEQGSKGSATIYMDGGDGKKYFNPFNIGAVVGNDVATALAKAKSMGWDTMGKGIEGGISFLKKGYLDNGQNTLYQNKFDININSGGNLYEHQYQQNLSAAYSEAQIFRKAYVDTGSLDNNIKFIIPLYENMPNEVSARPSGGSSGGETQNSEKSPMMVEVTNVNDVALKLRDNPSSSGKVIAEFWNGTKLLSVERLQNGWHRVVTENNQVGYSSGNYLKYVEDTDVINEKVKVNATSGVNIRSGPGTRFDKIGSLANGQTATRIKYQKYNIDGYIWDEIVTSSGVKGFVVSENLTKIN